MGRYREYPPRAALASWVRCLWSWRSAGARPRTRLVVPDACMDLLFVLEGPAELPRAMVVGSMTGPLPVEDRGAMDYLGVRFHPGAAVPFLETPARRLTDLRVPLEEVWGGRGTELWERLAALPPGGARLRLVERALLDHLAGSGGEADPRVRAAVARLEGRGGRLPVEALAREVGVGRRQLGRLFREQVGLPPKTVARVMRFQAARRRLEADPGASLGRVAVAAGYHDQPHLTREFRALAGEPPGRWLRRRDPPPPPS